jgi:multicomponent Na+:H+ antiporter subunit E
MRRFAAHVAALTGVWVLLWGRLTLANVITGVLVSSALLVVLPLERRRRSARVIVRPVATLRLVVHFVQQLFVANASMAWQIVRPHPALHPGVVVCTLHTRTAGLITIISNMLALSPGTLTVDVTTPASGPAMLSVHVLQAADVTAIRAQVAHLELLVVRALGAGEEVAACTGAQR